jgi:ABC-type multidrug transport system ATPase subunit
MAQAVVECMKALAQKGKTMICIIHQPSSDIFQMFDRLCLLAEGRMAYFGDLPQANNFFAKYFKKTVFNELILLLNIIVKDSCALEITIRQVG